MQKHVIDTIWGTEHYTFSRFQMNYYFLGIMMNFFERNGFTFHSFAEKENKNLFEIEHVFTSLDTKILSFFIKFIENNYLKRQQEFQQKALDLLVRKDSIKNLKING